MAREAYRPKILLLDFLIQLFDDPNQVAQYKVDPEGFLNDPEGPAAALLPQQREVLLSNDVLRISHAIDLEADLFSANPGLKGKRTIYVAAPDS